VQIARGGATRSSDEDSGVRDSLLEGGNADDVPASRRKWGRAVSLALDRGGVDEHYSRYRVLLRSFLLVYLSPQVGSAVSLALDRGGVHEHYSRHETFSDVFSARGSPHMITRRK